MTTTTEAPATVTPKNSTHSHLWWSATIKSTRPIPDQWKQQFFPDRASADWWANDGANAIKVEGNKMKKDGKPGKLRSQVYYYLHPRKDADYEQLPAPQWLIDLFEAAKLDPEDEPHDPERRYWG